MRYRHNLYDNQDVPPVAYCELCGGEVYPGGIRIRYNNRYLCSSCFCSSVRTVLWAYPEEFAQELGLEVERYG